MAQNFCTLDKAASSLDVSLEAMVEAWLDERLPFYIHLKHTSCTIRRCISPKLHGLAENDIRYGRDFYQAKDSPDYGISMFTPELPLDAHLKTKLLYDTTGEKIKQKGAFYEYRYRGVANGYWVLKPTSVAHLSNGEYVLTDVENASNYGDVTVHAHDEHDYLIFSECVSVVFSSLFVRMSEADAFFLSEKDNCYSQEGAVCESSTSEQQLISTNLPPKVAFALYLIMQEWCTKNKNGEIIISKVVDYFSNILDKPPGHPTVTRWAIKPDMESIVRKRAIPGQKVALHYLLKSYCEIKKIKESPSLIAKMLNDFAFKHGYDSRLSFDEEEVSAWMKKPK